jgi:hypothetical protein
MGILHMLTSLKSREKGANSSARKIAFDWSDPSFQPNIVDPVPEIMNVAVAEYRNFDPGRPFSLLAVLAAAKHAVMPFRTTSYHRTLMAAPPHPA